MPNQKILVVDDEEDILELVKYNLTKEGFLVTCAGNGEQALSRAAELLPDLIILDLMLPGIDGLDVCRRLKQGEKTRKLPIIMLTAKGEDADVVAGLELGADDYVIKPFSPRVLLARIKAALRRTGGEEPSDQDSIRRGDITINPSRHEVLVHGERSELTATEFRILHFLAKRPGWVFTREQIINAVRGHDYPVTERSVDVQVVGLRRKLGQAGDCVETVRGVGYRFRE
ncbi:MAG: response regulator transcription factor [Thermodesulfobacteriota bacterium]